MFQVRIDGILNRRVLLEVVLVDNGPRLLLVRAGAALQVGLTVMLDNVAQEIRTLGAELHLAYSTVRNP
jgi:hypothetical protein